MNTTVEALQNLYVAKGGTLSDVENLTTIPDMIEAIADITEDDTSGSVPVTSDEVDAIINSIS